MMFRIEHDWYSLMHNITKKNDIDASRQQLSDSLISLEPIFADKPYFLSEEFSLLDCTMAPLLWRLPALGINVPEEATGLNAYIQRLFKRDSFQTSLTDAERQLRAA